MSGILSHCQVVKKIVSTAGWVEIIQKIYLKMAAWPEFYFDSEFESASEYSTHTSAAVQLSMWRDPNTNSYGRHVQSQPQGANHRHSQGNQPQSQNQPLSEGIQRQSPSPAANRRKIQTQSRVIQPRGQPQVVQPSAVQPSAERKQPLNDDVHSQSQRQPLKVGVQSQPRPQGQPPDVQAPDQPPDPDPKSSVSKEDWGKGSIDPG